MIKYNLPVEDSLDGNAKEIAWNVRNVNKMDREIDKLSRLVKKSLNIKAIERLIY